MKKTTLILSAVALLGMVALGGCNSNPKSAAADNNTEVETAAAAKGSIVYFNLDRVLNEYDMANDLRSVAQTKAEGINAEVNRRGTKLQKDLEAFQDKINKGLLTRSVAETQSQTLAKRDQDFKNYAAQKQQEINEELNVMQNQIADAIKAFVDKYNAEKQFALIIACQGELLPLPIVAADPSLDVTDDILTRLNDEYVKTKAQKK